MVAMLTLARTITDTKCPRDQVSDIRLRMLHARPRLLLAVVACLLVSSATSLTVPTVSARLVDDALRRSDQAANTALFAGLVVILTMRLAAEVTGYLARHTAVAVATAGLRRDLLKHAFMLGVPGTRRYSTGDLVGRLVGNAGRAAEYVPAIASLVAAALTSVGGVVALWIIDWHVSVAFILAAIPVVFMLRHSARGAMAPFEAYQRHLGVLTARLSDAIAGAQTVRASGTFHRETERVLAVRSDLGKATRRVWAVQRSIAWKFRLALTGVSIFVLAVGGLGAAGGRLSAGDLLAVVMYVGYASAGLSQVDNLISLVSSKADANRISEVLEDSPLWQGHERNGRPDGAGEISIANVSYENLLRAIDLRVPAGSSMALVGRSGEGKTTLAMLVGGLLKPDAGCVSIDGTTVARTSEAVSYAFDRPVLYGATVREAVAYGSPGATAERIEAALHASGCQAFVAHLPNGADTPLLDARFSGGELQRLGLARALVQDRRVLVLDDATSSLDTVTEAQIAASITAGLAGQTRLIVTHRAATAARTDAVAWLDGGRVRAVATHAELWVTEPDYRALFGAVAADEAAAPPATTGLRGR
ncbi:ABC transporter ATP-binding protein [Kribbella sp. CA-253562]|uniref:ABC transporter ATP-binding protein n=1 Tax=Kribbella sp. CA-253562 TaxID=3239942 RepID=UPI003D939E0E